MCKDADKYEAGYRDGSIHYELEHCPACKNVADLQEALEENAKLRELVRGLHAAYVGMISQYEGGEESLILEYSSSIETDIDNLQSECDEARHRFDVALRDLRIEVEG